jgi:hypothetical protein
MAEASPTEASACHRIVWVTEGATDVHTLSRPAQLRQNRLCLRQPQGHVHGAVQMHSHAQFCMRARHPSSLAIQGTEAAVVVGLQRTHTERLGQDQGLLVVRLGPLNIGGIGVGIERHQAGAALAPRHYVA